MLPDPLHPAIVHFPIVLTLLLPISAAGALWAIRRGARPQRAWAIPLALVAALAVSSFLAVQTGASQEERVESVVAEEAIEIHEEAGERFLVLSGVLALVMAGGLLAGTAGTAARYVGTLGAAALVVLAIQVGDAGGKLVYEHGAAAAYVTSSAPGGGPSTSRIAERREHEEDDD